MPGGIHAQQWQAALLLRSVPARLSERPSQRRALGRAGARAGAASGRAPCCQGSAGEPWAGAPVDTAGGQHGARILRFAATTGRASSNASSGLRRAARPGATGKRTRPRASATPPSSPVAWRFAPAAESRSLPAHPSTSGTRRTEAAGPGQNTPGATGPRVGETAPRSRIRAGALRSSRPSAAGPGTGMRPTPCRTTPSS